MFGRSIFCLMLLLQVVGSPALAAMSGTSDAIASQHAPASTVQIIPASLSPALPKAEPSIRRFDGTWTVRTSPGCLTLARSTFTVSNGRVSGPNTTGRIDVNGNVRSVGRGGYITIISTGRVTEQGGSGVYRQNDGCSGTWTSAKR